MEDSIENIKQKFVENFSKYIEDKIDVDFKEFKIFVAPICIYDSSLNDNDGLACLSLSERGDFLSDDNIYSKENISLSLFNIFSQIGIILKPDTFFKCIVDIQKVDFSVGLGLIFICHILNLDSIIEDEYLSKIKTIPIEKIQIESKDISVCVRKSIYNIIPCFEILSKRNKYKVDNISF